ncbi:helix-turn-helix domain-containing protein [Cryptosporangium minutisporangium]|uniref:Helix-turn-helix transcriptional regulator n=1 Tax=Cryptosporangium minutisporangium TaxID=113569 RepID=A0ABP6SVX4_9ACTN
MTDASSGGSPALRRLEVAAALRRHRKAARLSTAEVLARVGFSASKLSRIETGNRTVQVSDLEVLCGLYGVDGHEQQRLTQLVDESRQPSVWTERETTNPAQAEYLELEEAASAIDDYKSSMVTALLQTSAYMRAFFRALSPHLPISEIEQQVSDRNYRQQKIMGRTEKEPLRFILDEAALWRQVGGPQVLRAQLAHLADLTWSPAVSIFVIPFNRGAHIGVNSLFTILTFEESVRDRVYVDGLRGPEYLAEAKDVERYRGHFEDLLGKALDRTSSRDLILDIKKRL